MHQHKRPSKQERLLTENNATDTNSIIILYPQAVVDNTPHVIWSGTALSNPNACFDWVGWYGSSTDQKGGKWRAPESMHRIANH